MTKQERSEIGCLLMLILWSFVLLAVCSPKLFTNQDTLDYIHRMQQTERNGR